MSDTTNYLLESMNGYASAAAEEVKQVKAGAGRLFKLTAVNVNVAARYLYVFDSAAADAGTLLIPPVPVPIGAAGSFDISFQYGKKFALGLRVHASSTQATFTASAGADLLISASYI